MKAWLLAGALLAALGAGTMYVDQSARLAALRSRIAKERPRVERLGDIQRRVDVFEGLGQELRQRVNIIEELKAGDTDLLKAAAAETRTSLGSLPLDIERLVARGDFVEVTVRPAQAGSLRDPTALERALRAAGLEPTRLPLPRLDGTLSFVMRRRPAKVRR